MFEHAPTPYSPIVDRPRLAGPEGARLVVHLIVNVEEWPLTRAMPRTIIPPPQGGSYIPDVPNYAWAEYGMRVGIWRFFDVLERYGVRPSMTINANVCNRYPQIARRAVDAGWEPLGHGFVQRPLPMEDDERATIRATLDTIEAFSGTRPRGWLGPGLVESWATLENLRAEGVEYVCDWGHMDDQPFDLATPLGPITAIPYTVDMNDIVMYAVQHHRSDELYERGRRQFDTLYAESLATARVMAIALHPYLTGAPHRIGALDQLLAYISGHAGVTFLRASEIHAWHRSSARVHAG